MNPVIGTCPICQQDLVVTQLHCRNCDTTLGGQFALGRLFHLQPQQLQFVEIFIRCEGKITRVEQELGMSYPAVRARLNEVIRALGYEVGESSEAVRFDEEERQRILQQISLGEMSADEAIELLQGD
jgi:hypothetical protein